MAIGYLEEDGRLSVRAQPAELRFVSGALFTLPELQQHRPQEGFSRLPGRTV